MMANVGELADDISADSLLPAIKSISTGKRHFPHLNNVVSAAIYKTNARRFMPHGYSEDYKYRPHSTRPARAKYINLRPDQSLQLYYSNSYHCQRHGTDNQLPDVLRSTESGQGVNYTHPIDCDSARHGTAELSSSAMSTRFTGLKYLRDRRNNIPVAAPGDKSYRSVEYSPDFFKYGTTVPLVNFGRLSTEKPSIFVPPPTSGRTLGESYRTKELHRQLEAEISDVMLLDSWRPASPLVGLGAGGGSGGTAALTIGQTTTSSSFSQLRHRKR